MVGSTQYTSMYSCGHSPVKQLRVVYLCCYRILPDSVPCSNITTMYKPYSRVVLFRFEQEQIKGAQKKHY